MFTDNRTPSPVKEGGDESTVKSNTPTKSSTPSKVPVVTVTVTESPVSKDSSKDEQTVDTGPTPPITPDRDATASTTGGKRADSKDADGQTTEESKSTEDAQVVGSGTESGNKSNESGKKDGKKNDTKKKTPSRKSPLKQSPSKEKERKENQDPSSVKATEEDGSKVKEEGGGGEEEESVKKEGRGSESDQKGADATSTTSTGGVQTSGSEDMSGKIGKRNRRSRVPRKVRNEDGGLVNPPFKHNLPLKEGEESAISSTDVKGKDPVVDLSKLTEKRSQRGGFQRRGPRSYRGGYRGDRPGMFVARDTKPRPIKSGDESAADGDNKKPSTSEGGPTEGSGTETEKPVTVQQRKRNRNKNRQRRRKSGSRNREQGQEDGGQSDTQNGYSSHGEGKVDEQKSGGQEPRTGQPPRRRRGPRGPKKNPDGTSNQRVEGDDVEVGIESQSNQPPRREGGGWNRGRGHRGWNRPRGFGPRGGGNFGGGGWSNDHRQVDSRQIDSRQVDSRHNDTKFSSRDHDSLRRDDDRGGYQRRSDNYNRDHQGYHDSQRPFNRRDTDDSRTGGSYGPRSYGNSNFGRGGANFGSSNYGDRSGSFGTSDRGGNQGGYQRGRGGSFRGGYSETRTSGFNPRGSGPRSFGAYSASRSNHPDRNSSSDVTPIDVVKLSGHPPGQSTSSINTHQGGFWN